MKKFGEFVDQKLCQSNTNKERRNKSEELKKIVKLCCNVNIWQNSFELSERERERERERKLTIKIFLCIKNSEKHTQRIHSFGIQSNCYKNKDFKVKNKEREKEKK